MPPLSPARVEEMVGLISNGRRILVVGDVMLDQFIVGQVSRISPEAPVPVVAFERDEYRAGGAGNVAMNARRLGARVDLVGLLGADEAAGQLRDLLRSADVPVDGLVTDERRRTTAKVRIVTTRKQQVARVDYECDDPASAAIEDALIAQVIARTPGVNAIVVSDYVKGAVSARLMTSLVAAGRHLGVPILVDPKIPHLDFYAGATLITPNHHEAEIATNVRIRGEDDARRAATAFRERAQCDGVIITRGEHGMWLACDGVEGHLPAAAREVADVTGAGDTVIATLAIALAGGATMMEAAQLANEAAGLVVGRFGPASVTPPELIARFADTR
ncbi:MAG: D-glycero-beta-D-manno-heptose-7-phosphate kinase [Acidobacteriota bacterium]